MVGGYDEMTDRSYADYLGGTSLQRYHRDLLRRAMQDALGARAAQLEEAAAKYDRSSTRVPKGESTILWLRKNMPDRVDEILSRAREYYRALT